MTIHHNNKTHFGIFFHPLFLKRLTKDDEIKGFLTFGRESVYNIESDDKYDWNKVVGLSDDLIDTRKRSAMLAMRIIDRKVQLNLYTHDEHLRSPENTTGKWWGSTPMEFSLYDRIYFSLSNNGSQASLITTNFSRLEQITSVVKYDFNEPNHPRMRRIIWPWFGGQQKRKMKYELEIL